MNYYYTLYRIAMAGFDKIIVESDDESPTARKMMKILRKLESTYIEHYGHQGN